MSFDINYAAVLVSAIASTVVGALWYSPLLFGKLWMRLSGFSGAAMPEKSDVAKLYAASFMADIVTAGAVAILINAVNTFTVGEGLSLALLVWLGFVATTTLGTVLWERKPIALYILNNAFKLVSILIMAVILSVWQ